MPHQVHLTKGTLTQAWHYNEIPRSHTNNWVMWKGFLHHDQGVVESLLEKDFDLPNPVNSLNIFFKNMLENASSALFACQQPLYMVLAAIMQDPLIQHLPRVIILSNYIWTPENSQYTTCERDFRWSEPYRVLHVCSRSRPQQHLHQPSMPIVRCIMQRSLLVLILCVWVGPVFQ